MVSMNAAMRPAVPAELRDWVDNRLLSAHIRIVKWMMLGSLLNSAVLVAALWGDIPDFHLALFALSMIAAVLHRVWLAEGVARGRRQKRTGKMHAAFRMSSVWLGLNLGLLLAMWLPVVPPPIQLLLAISGVTQIASAAYTVRTMPHSATIYILTQAFGLAIGLAQLGQLSAWGGIVVLSIATGLLVRMAYTAHDLFVTRILSDRELAATTRTVRLLLNEYEESSSDWLFELDVDGRLHAVSKRFSAAVGIPAKVLEEQQFIDLFTADAGRKALEEALANRHPLRDEVLALVNLSNGGSSGHGETNRWWSVSGRPCYVSGQDRVAYRGVISDVTSQRLAESRVHHMAHYDALTGLPNRALFNQTLAELLDQKNGTVHAALLLIDVDHFKAVNDMYGHPVGDAYLRALGERISSALDNSGLGGAQRLVARLSGDEFAIVVTGENACDHAVRLADMLIQQIPEPVMIDGHELVGGISIGIALAPHHAVLKQQLFSNADIALYAAKDGGRGMWEMFEPGMDAALHERHTLARDLRYAVANGELRLFVQPLVDIETEVMTGYEALLRWQHPTRGLVSPDVFIPIAEETGLIVPIGEWVIRTALAEAARWPGKETIAINLSPVQIGNQNLLPVIINALAQTGLEPARVEFEITEGVLLHNSDTNIEVLNRLHDLGVKIALDDFGTGYASLNYLLTFPFDKIKIDRRFISELSTRAESRAIVGAVIGLANQLGVCTLAEGVEEPDQLERLKAHGCRMVQGWLFGKALPSESYHPAALALPVFEPTPLKPVRKTSGSKTYSRRAAG